MNPWHGYPVPAMRREALAGDRLVACFAERPASFHALFARAVAERGDHEALCCAGRRWTYRDADTEVARIAAGLLALGLARGDRAALLIGNRPEFVFVLFALQRIGAIAVPIGVREQRPGLAYMLGQCGAKAIVFDAELADRVPDRAEVASLQWRIAIGAVEGAHALDALPATANGAAVSDVHEQDTAVILYTSGTTGHPKGAMLTHLNIVHSALHYEACMRLGPADRSALAVPASHVTGLIATIAAMVHVGGTIVVVPEFKAADFVRVVEAERVTHTLMVPAMYKLCLLAPELAARDLGSWRIGGYGGAPMPVATIDALAQRLPNLTLVNAYGATETTSPTTTMPAGLTRAHADTVGVALPCAEIAVMDDAGCEVPTGEPGELWIGGPMVVPGYWDNPEATAAAFTAGFWHSGDLGSVDAQGYVRIFDRKKDMLNRGGYKIYSVEVENALMTYPGVVEAAIVARACPVLGERVHAVLYAPGAARDDESVRAHCRRLLADYKVPETCTWSDAPLPRNANGKVMKRLLRESVAAAEAPKPS
ncbi:MAG: class I adenylate-forming enzyme family protein [Caldimonas sp.]